MEKVVISVVGGVASVEFQTEDVGVCIFDLDSDPLYLYKDEFVCSVTGVNDDGTVDIKLVSSLNDKPMNRTILGVPAGMLSYYSSDSDFLDDDIENEEEL